LALDLQPLHFVNVVAGRVAINYSTHSKVQNAKSWASYLYEWY